MYPEWASCTPYQAGGLYDPPKTLSRGAVLVPTTVQAQPTTFVNAEPGLAPKLPAITATFQATSSTQSPEVVAEPTPNPKEGKSPLATLVLPGPVVVQPDQDPIIFEPGQTPRLNTLIPPRIAPRPTDVDDPGAAAMIAQTQAAAPAPKSNPPVLTFKGATVTADSAGQFVIGSQTLIPGGTVIVDSTTLSFDAAGSYVVVNAASTISFAQTPSPQHIDNNNPEEWATLILGDTTTKLPDGQWSVRGGITTRVPAHSGSNNEDPYTLVLDGSTTTFNNGRAVVLGGSTTIVPAITAYHTTLITLTLGGKTLTLPNGAVAVVGGTQSVITASMSPGAKSLTLTYGGRTVTLSDGRMSVVDATVTVVAVPNAASKGSATTAARGDVDALQDEKSWSSAGGPTWQGSDQFSGSARPTSAKSGSGRVQVVCFDAFILLILELVVLYSTCR